MKKLIIMRGLPGSGKSTFVKREAQKFLNDGVRSVAICSTDDQFLDANGNYVFDAAKLGVNHRNNQMKCRKMMSAEVDVIFIDNTNTTRKEMQPYKDLADAAGYVVEEVLIGMEHIFPSMDASPHAIQDYIDLCAKRNTHGVPREAIERMVRRFEE